MLGVIELSFVNEVTFGKSLGNVRMGAGCLGEPCD